MGEGLSFCLNFHVSQVQHRSSTILTSILLWSSNGHHWVLLHWNISSHISKCFPGQSTPLLCTWSIAYTQQWDFPHSRGLIGQHCPTLQNEHLSDVAYLALDCKFGQDRTLPRRGCQSPLHQLNKYCRRSNHHKWRVRSSLQIRLSAQ